MIMTPAANQWMEQIPIEEWNVYQPVLQTFSARGPQFAVGGGFAFSYHTGMWRNTKDLDLYVQPADRNAAIEILAAHGFEDMHNRAPYDQRWIYRGYRDGLIIDVIWQMANHRAVVDEMWILRGPQAAVHSLILRVLPCEELMFTKLYIIQRDRCDWPDLLNILHAAGKSMDWRHLLFRLEDDVALLQGLLSVYAWLCPHAAMTLPEWLWESVGLSVRRNGPHCIDGERVNLLDSRPWFTPIEERRSRNL